MPTLRLYGYGLLICLASGKVLTLRQRARACNISVKLASSPLLVNVLYYSTYLYVKFTTLVQVVPAVEAMKVIHLTGVIRLLMTCLEIVLLPCIHWQLGGKIIRVGSRLCPLTSWYRDNYFANLWVDCERGGTVSCREEVILLFCFCGQVLTTFGASRWQNEGYHATCWFTRQYSKAVDMLIRSDGMEVP